MVNAMDTSYAKTVSQINPTRISTFVPAIDSVLRAVSLEPVSYGNIHVTRPISMPDERVNVSRHFAPGKTKRADKKVQDVDLACLNDRLVVPKVDYHGDVNNVMNHVRDIGRNFIEGVEHVFLIGSSDPTTHGVIDYPEGTSGTINRPEQTAPVTTAGDWNTTANIRTDFINSILTLTSKGFKGRKIAIAPEIVKPMLTELISSTAIPIAQWFSATFGLPIVFSDSIDSDATKDTFDVYVIDTDRVHLAMSELQLSSFYDDKDHAYFWDYEDYLSAVFDPLHDGTEWLKGVSCISQCDWSD